MFSRVQRTLRFRRHIKRMLFSSNGAPALIRVATMFYGKVETVVVMGKSGAGKQPRINVLKELFQLEQFSTGDVFREAADALKRTGFNKPISRIRDYEANEFLPDRKIKAILGPKADDKAVLGAKATFFMDSGLFVPDSLTSALVTKKFDETKFSNMILDGYPRTKPQATHLMSLLSRQDRKPDFVLVVDNDDDIIIGRAIGRRVCHKCKKVYHVKHLPSSTELCADGKPHELIRRKDDTEENIRSRLQQWYSFSVPALELFKKQGIPVASVWGHLEPFSSEAVRESVLKALDEAQIRHP